MQAALSELADSHLVIGVIGERAKWKPANGGKVSKVNMADIASFNEFGTSKGSWSGKGIPARPFMRSTFDEQQEKYTLLLNRVIKHILAGNITPATALNRLGLMVKSDVQSKINNLRTPPNSQVTIDNKGSSNPLIQYGRLKQSIEYEIRKAKP